MKREEIGFSGGSLPYGCYDIKRPPRKVVAVFCAVSYLLFVAAVAVVVFAAVAIEFEFEVFATTGTID